MNLESESEFFTKFWYMLTEVSADVRFQKEHPDKVKPKDEEDLSKFVSILLYA